MPLETTLRFAMEYRWKDNDLHRFGKGAPLETNHKFSSVSQMGALGTNSCSCFERERERVSKSSRVAGTLRKAYVSPGLARRHNQAELGFFWKVVL